MEKFLTALINYALAFGLTLLMTFAFFVQFGFEWSFLLGVCVYMALCALKWACSNE